MNHKRQDILLVEYYRGAFKKNSHHKTCSIFAGFGNIFNEINIAAVVPLFTVKFICNNVLFSICGVCSTHRIM